VDGNILAKQKRPLLAILTRSTRSKRCPFWPVKGADPGKLPITQATKFDFVVNLKTAKALGITFPPSILLQATKVIE
jgi:hypothetical protein